MCTIYVVNVRRRRRCLSGLLYRAACKRGKAVQSKYRTIFAPSAANAHTQQVPIYIAHMAIDHLTRPRHMCDVVGL